MRFLFSCLLLALLGGCGPSGPDGPVQVAIIGDPGSLTEEGVRLSPAGQHLRAATIEGLVGLDETGQVIPALAERWIVTDDGLSYIFRLRNSDWPDGRQIGANDVRQSLRESIRQLRGTSLGLDLGKVSEIRAMTGRVVEIRLTSPMPDFLRLLAQPELGIARNDAGAGPMTLAFDEESGVASLTALPPERRGLPARENWEDLVRPLILRALPARAAVEAFRGGEVDLVLNGQIDSLPLADTGPLSRGAVRIDGARGLFGLIVRSNDGFLADPARREALAMSIDRDGLMQPLNIGGWQSSTWVVPVGLFGNSGPQAERWENLSLQQRREIARGRVRAWEAAQGKDAVVRIAMPPGPGSDRLFAQIAGDFGLVGVTAVQAKPGDAADLELFDRLARYESPRWYLNQLNCGLRVGLCSSEADRLVALSVSETDPVAKAQLLDAANREIASANVYIPLGAPVRWSLVRGDISGFEANVWGMHPLFPLVEPTR